jgi:heme/copper-type cytochrome/quinol oxidase subunit 3
MQNTLTDNNIPFSLNKKWHPFHIVDPSPWPFFVSLQVFILAVNFICYMHKYNTVWPLFFSFVFFSIILGFWFTDVVYEGTYLGHHTLAVQWGLRFGFILFLLSEVMFFVSFFWAFFHSSLAPSIWIGGVWPPVGIVTLDPWKIPLFNTCVLLLSGATVTWCQAAVIGGNSIESLFSLFYTVVLGVLFTASQYFEYLHAPFSIADGIYGSLFYMMTGFHGIHVIIGTIFLIVAFFRLRIGHFTKEHHIGLEIAAWYWHFVDVVWLFLYAVVYIWSNSYK